MRLARSGFQGTSRAAASHFEPDGPIYSMTLSFLARCRCYSQNLTYGRERMGLSQMREPVVEGHLATNTLMIVTTGMIPGTWDGFQ